jgi:hypothetical protein
MVTTVGPNSGLTWSKPCQTRMTAGFHAGFRFRAAGPRSPLVIER